MPRPPTYNRKVDLNHGEVRDAIRRAGYKVEDYSRLGNGIFDLLAYTPDKTFSCWVEVKQKGETLTEAEEFFYETAPGHKVIVYGPEDAIAKLYNVRFNGVPNGIKEGMQTGGIIK